MNFSFNIEDDTLFLNVTTPTEEEDTEKGKDCVWKYLA